MNHCFYCSRPIQLPDRGKRRRVKVGETINHAYTSNRLVTTRSEFAMRLVCSRCTAFLESQERKREIQGMAALGAAVLVLSTLIAFYFASLD